MDESLKALIDPAKNILIVLPVKFNFDQVASGLSLYLSLMEGRSIEVYCPSQMTVGVNRLVGVQRIKQEVGNKNLAMTFKNYEASGIEKVSYDIIEGEFKLTIVPKIGFNAPNKEDVEYSYSGLAADLVILIGGATDSDFPILEMPEIANAKIVHIGNRSFNSNHNVMSFATRASSISEVIAILIKNNGFALDPDTATNLVMGVESGSANFTSPDTTADTFEIFASLLRAGGVRRPKVIENFPVGSIPNQVPQNPTPSSSAKATEDAAVDKDSTNEAVEAANPPADWLAQPKVYKGTSTV